MTFIRGKRTGKLWADVQTIINIVDDTNCNIGHKSERELESHLYGCIDSHKTRLNKSFIFQRNQNQTVNSAKFFGKSHRPDMTLDNDGLAIELKFVNSSLDSARTAIGQGFIYRKEYKFVVLILVISKKHADEFHSAYEDNIAKADKSNIFHKLADDNIFTVVKAGFAPKKGYGDTIVYPVELKNRV